MCQTQHIECFVFEESIKESLAIVTIGQVGFGGTIFQ
ncbi:hypothetical protein V202x_01620 [Gimesia aquarii]|uniref:Uncharacterized protein n=1 Tax=Gimesia aquarii TaxID=2527964 RepID=A0A517WNH6_9PLAN|nr:hypothetical protein V202x_01620 [Gimesia aquarii]